MRPGKSSRNPALGLVLALHGGTHGRLSGEVLAKGLRSKDRAQELRVMAI